MDILGINYGADLDFSTYIKVKVIEGEFHVF